MPVPVVVGVADVKNRSQEVENAVEPAQLMLRAIEDAFKDAGTSSQKLQSNIDSIAAVRTWTWPYPDLLGLLSEKLGVTPKHKYYSEHGGDKPCKIFGEAARRIARGESRVAVVTGGEALASRTFHHLYTRSDID
jgi:acetyl-CoA acetyltransferase